MDHQTGASGTNRNIAVVIAHGVGEADPGYAATTLSRTLGKCADFRADDEIRVRYLADPNAPAHQPDCTFPVFISSGRLASGQRMTFAELYWADLTKVGPSRMDAILGFFRIIFEAHHFIDGMLDRNKGLGTRILRHLLLIASWMLRGPIVGLVITTATLFWAALYIPVEVMTETTLTLWFSGVAAAVFLLSTGLLITAIRRGDATWYDPTAWAALLAAIIAIAFATIYFLDLRVVSDCPKLPRTTPVCRQNYIDGVYELLGLLWRIWGAIILLSFLIAIGVAFRRRRTPNEAPPVFTALGVVLLQFVLWTAIVGTAAMPLIYRAEEIKGINALQMGPESLPASATSRPSAERLLNVVPWYPDQSDWINRLAFGYGFNGFMIFCVVLVGATTHLRRYRLARRSSRDPRISAAGMPRMIVGQAILVVLMVVVFWQALYLLFRIEPEHVVAFVRGVFGLDTGVIATGWKRAILAIGWISTLSLPILASTRLGNFVHIARDLIDHQYSHRRASMLTRARRSRDAEHWPRRARIQARLATLLDELVRDGKFDQVIFVVHSQGSVIAFDYLKDAVPANKELNGSRPDIITFGSPLAHLYEYYFFEYGKLNKDIMAMRNGIGRWINVYRIDDYIGTDIAGGTDTCVSNKQIGRGGHTDYWKEEDLARIVFDLATRPAGDSVDSMQATGSGP